jgi:hypothetical protein
VRTEKSPAHRGARHGNRGTPWAGRRFRNAEELPRAARKYTAKPVTADDVTAIVEYQPRYDGSDLRYVLEAMGWKPRPERLPRKRLLELANKVRLDPPPGFDLDAFLDGLVPGLAGSERRKAADIVLSAVSARVTTLDDRGSWRFLLDRLSKRFPGRGLPARHDWESIEKSFVAICRAQIEKVGGGAMREQCWQHAGRIARRVVNRGHREDRMWWQLYVEDLVFNYLWYGIPITESDIAYSFEVMSNKVWDARVALFDALEDVAPPRSFESLASAAYRRVRASDPSSFPDYESFRRLVYRNTTAWYRKRLVEMNYEPLELMQGSDSRLR